jgi:hypothetical protein
MFSKHVAGIICILFLSFLTFASDIPKGTRITVRLSAVTRSPSVSLSWLISTTTSASAQIV